MALPVAVFLLALASLSAATAPDCKDLVKPFMPEDPKLVSCAYDPFSVLFIPMQLDFILKEHIINKYITYFNVVTLILTFYVKVFGKWVYVMGAGDPKPYHKALESLKSSWIDLSPTSDSQIVTLHWGDHCL